MPRRDNTSETQTVTAADVGSVEAVPVKLDPHAVHAKAAVVVDKEIFCAGCQAKTVQKMSRDRNHEMVATCDCGRTLKFPLFNPPDDCPDCKEETKHKLANTNGTVHAVCDCGTKLPVSLFDLDQHLDKHHKANVGQITVEMADADAAVFDAHFKQLMKIGD